MKTISWAEYLGQWDLLVTALALYVLAISREIPRTQNVQQRTYLLMAFFFACFVGAWEFFLGPRPDVILVSHGVPALVVALDILKKVPVPSWMARWIQ